MEGRAMKAIQVQEYGHADQMKLSQIQRPKPGQGQVLVKIHDAGLNPVDWKIREGYLKDVRPTSFPYTMGQDFAGEVMLTGKGVTGFKQGDRVFGFATGSYAEYALAYTDGLAHIPRSLDYEHAACIPTAGLTAWQIVSDVAKVSQNETVLILGAGGGVGTFTVQFAKRAGAHVIVTASRDDFSFLEERGASQMIDYKPQRFEDIVKDVDVVFDLVGGETLKRAYHCVKPNGLVITTVGPADEAEARSYNARVVQFIMQPDSGELAQISRLVEKGEVKPRLSKVMPLDEAKAAEDLLQLGHPHGKVILHIA
jgi:NADPH:quinone reductase-like Zn-dependent oxidoreductase